MAAEDSVAPRRSAQFPGIGEGSQARSGRHWNLKEGNTFLGNGFQANEDRIRLPGSGIKINKVEPEATQG